MSDDTPEEAIERGLEAYFAGDTITDLLAGIDVNALAEGEALDDVVEYEQLGKALGAVVGRAAIKSASNSGLPGRLVKESLGSELGGRVGETIAAALVEHGDPEALAAQLQAVSDPERLDQLAAAVEDAIAETGIAEADVEEFGSATEEGWTAIDVEGESDE
jgi:hypothetical protein